MDVVESISFLHTLYQLTNLSPWLLNRQSWSFTKSRSLEVYTVLVIMGSSVFMLYSFFTENDFTKTSDNEIGQTVDFIQMVGIRMAHIVSIAEALVRKEEQKKFHEQLQQIDHIFNCDLNVNINNRKFRECIVKRGIVMFLIYMLSDFIILASKMITAKRNFFLFWIFYIMPMMICGLRYFQMFTSIMIVRSRLTKLMQVLSEVNLLTKSTTTATTTITNKLNNTIEPLLLTPSSPPSASLASSNIHQNHSPLMILSNNSSLTSYTKHLEMRPEIAELQKLIIIRDIYNRLYALTTIINRYFGVSMLINVGNDFISITSNCYWIFINFKEYSSTTADFLQTVCSTVWSVPHILNVLILVIMCERTVHSTIDLALVLHRIECDHSNYHYNSLITQFSLQLLHQKISLTAAGFFNIDCTVLYTIAGATTTYLIILIQFHLNENKRIT